MAQTSLPVFSVAVPIVAVGLPILIALALCVSCSAATRIRCSCFVFAVVAGLGLISSFLNGSKTSLSLSGAAYATAIVSILLSNRCCGPRLPEKKPE